MKSGSRFWLVLVAALVLVTVLAGGAGSDGPPLDPRSVNPDGTRALIETLERLGADVQLDRSVPGADSTAALLIVDRLSDDDAEQVRTWVRDGGTLVVTDPASRFAPFRSGFAGGETSSGDCTISWFENARIAAEGRTFDPGNADHCFGTRDQAFVTIESRGAGRIVALGGPRLFTNEQLGRLDHAYVGTSLLAPEPQRARVSVLSPSLIDFGDQSLDGLVATRIRNAIIMALAAFCLYALFRMRRLGSVVREPQPVPIRGSELVLQAGVLSERAKDPASAAETIRHDFIRRWRRTLALDHDDPARLAEQLVATHATRGGQAASGSAADHDYPDGAYPDAAALVEALTRPVATNADLLEVVRCLDLADHDPTQSSLPALDKPDQREVTPRV